MDYVQSDISSLFAFPAFEPMLHDYADECSISGLPRPNPNQEMYCRIEANGILDVYLALDGADLAGFAAVLHTVYPHYGLEMSTVESIFVPKAYRSKGAGIGLLNLIERHARGTGLFVSAPVGSQFEGVLHGRRYTNTNAVFFLPLGVRDVTGADRVCAAV